MRDNKEQLQRLASRWLQAPCNGQQESWSSCSCPCINVIECLFVPGTQRAFSDALPRYKRELQGTIRVRKEEMWHGVDKQDTHQQYSHLFYQKQRNGFCLQAYRVGLAVEACLLSAVSINPGNVTGDASLR